MALFDIDFFAKVVEFLPPDYRFAVNVAWIRALISPLVVLKYRILTYYRTGWIFTTPYIPGYPYTEGAIVTYKQVLYQSATGANTDTPPSVNWQVYLPSFIGVNDRIKYNGNKLVLEFALNQRFGGVFRQPTTELYPHVSDIWCDTIGFSTVGFLVGQTTGTAMGATTSAAGIGFNYPLQQVHNFNINIPNALYISVSDQEIRAFVNDIIPQGLTYTITPY